MADRSERYMADRSEGYMLIKVRGILPIGVSGISDMLSLRDGMGSGWDRKFFRRHRRRCLPPKMSTS